MHQISFCFMSVYCLVILKWWLSQVHYWSTNWTQAVSYSSLENFMVSTIDSACLLNTGPVFTSKLFEVLQIVLRGLVLKSGSEWPHKKIYTFSSEWENSCNTYIIHQIEARAFGWSNAYLIKASPNICWGTPDGSVPFWLHVHWYT